MKREKHGPQFVAIVGRKGGTGKTTLALSLSADYARAGLRVLLVDLDPQGSASLAAGATPTGSGLVAYLDPSAAKDNTQPARPVSVASGLDLFTGGPELETLTDAQPMRKAFGGSAYDVVLFDCPPGHTALDRLAIECADVVLACCEPHRLAIAGAARVLDEARALRPAPRCAIVLGRMDERRGLDRAAADLLAGAFSLPVLTVRQDAALAAALNAGSLPPEHGRAANDVAAVAAWSRKEGTRQQ